MADQEVPVCGPHERLGTVRFRLAEKGASSCVVINDAEVVLGLLKDHALEGDLVRSAETMMDFAVTTVRPAEELGPLLARMEQDNLQAMVVTRSDGTLYGLLTMSSAKGGLGISAPDRS